MVVMTAKVSKAKIIAVVCILAALICAALFLLSDSNNNASPAANVTTNESRIAYLASCGWEVNPQPTETQEVLIPEEMNDVFLKYNELQRSQGFDLSRFAGQKVKRFVYSVTNYSGTTEPVYATLLIADGAVVGGDITLTAGTGQMHALRKADTSAPSSPEAAEATTATEEEIMTDPLPTPAV